MKYNLQKYDEVISKILSPQYNQFDRNVELFSLNDFLKNENTKIKSEIRETVFRLKSDSKIEHYIHKQQLALENMITFVRREINPERRKDLYIISQDIPKDKLKIVYKKLEKLQIFLENDYPIYLSADRIVPYRSFAKKKKANLPKIERIRKSKTSAELSLELLEIICHQNNLSYGSGINYYKFRYNNKFISELHLHLNEQKGIIYDDAIILFLLEINHNTKSFFKFLVRKINEDLDKLKTVKEKIDFLSYNFKTFKQIDIYEKNAYKRKRIHICRQILNWIEQEIKFLSQHQFSDGHLPQQVTVPSTKTNKLKVEISVAQLCCIFNLFCTVGVIKPQNHADLFRFISLNFESVNTKNISENSIKNRFYNPETSTIESVKSLIIQILNIIKK